jgi:hypothetical protein
MVKYLDGRPVAETAVTTRGGVLSNKAVLAIVAISVVVVVVVFAVFRRMA